MTRDVAMPRMATGLPATPDERLQSLLLACVQRAILDDSDEWLMTPLAGLYMHYIGMSDEAILALRYAWCRGWLDADAFDERKLHRSRFEFRSSKAKVAEQKWQSWPEQGATPLRHA